MSKQVTCPKCGSKMSTNRNTCPYCGAFMAGTVNGIVQNTAKAYVEEKFHGARGHGFAAESANDLYDNFTGKDAKIVGGDNAKDGADRIVNGTNIQSKYCSSGSKCIQECFRDGKFRYYNPDGSPMQIEVPSDKYDDAVKAMQNRIDRGEIRGVKNATDIVRKGNITYEQAKNIAKAGTIDSLVYDAAQGVSIAKNAGGISAAITFAVATWNGKNFDEALEEAVNAGLKVGGMAWASSVLVGQMTKAGLNSALVSASESLVQMMGPKASAYLVNAFRSGTNIYGAAAMKSASKLLRGNAISGLASMFILSAGDIANIFRGRISAGQFVKNVVNTGAGVAGGIGGWTAGATAGAAIGSVIPGVGTAVGGFLGGLFGAFKGGEVASKVSKEITDDLIEDDSKEMLRILESEFKDVANDYLLNKSEGEKVADNLKYKLDGGDKLKDMYAASNRYSFARNLLESCTEPVVRSRKKIYLPTTENYVRGLKKVLEKDSTESNSSNNVSNKSASKTNLDDNIIVEMKDEYGNVYYYLEEMIVPVDGEKFALLTSVHDDDNFDDEEDVIVAKIILNDNGEEEYIEPTDKEFERFQQVYEELMENI